MILYDNRYWGLPLIGRLYGSAFPRAFLFASLTALETALLYKYAYHQIAGGLRNPTIFQIFAFVVGFALVFRSSLSYNRFWEARTMLQTVMGRLTYFTVEALRKDSELGDLYPHDVAGPEPFLDANLAVHGWQRWEAFLVHVLSLHSLLGAAAHQQEAGVPVIGGLREEERRRLTELMPRERLKGRCSALNGARPVAVFALINQLYIRRISEGGLATLPPLASRLGGIAEEAMAAFGHCSKLASTQFPFPWAQVVMAFLAMLALALPLAVVSSVSAPWAGVGLSSLVVLTYWSLNEVAAEMEDPFGYDPNDLPLARYAFDFNNEAAAEAEAEAPSCGAAAGACKPSESEAGTPASSAPRGRTSQQSQLWRHERANEQAVAPELPPPPPPSPGQAARSRPQSAAEAPPTPPQSGGGCSAAVPAAPAAPAAPATAMDAVWPPPQAPVAPPASSGPASPARLVPVDPEAPRGQLGSAAVQPVQPWRDGGTSSGNGGRGGRGGSGGGGGGGGGGFRNAVVPLPPVGRART
ncbi:hypothetical protein GPECTOR_63g13 [Gonium pectorale]|uniref:Uncharacterized protein n=1 Tax=Gonium pectorale TaxID=33097 RepID=A0A150G4D1_GONPE|nr:hypothetical protein GPECTOR_63g13 [Gonium pectorale]|eukprot:KXZ44684.1 hypothetical protein GPECTOR_63g13 [Gonium pectorale]